ncbi:hypothetical protein FGO68_gene9696 [Halteria grandinella]|uniref:Uncharacterized protein n=1 Tax=Halteria grandinella TaxID=5974 RepID=A0A8J8SZW9_HALGN|nr:hypothetical protein FGO68_gene9696 [Halteria grandinella]
MFKLTISASVSQPQIFKVPQGQAPHPASSPMSLIHPTDYASIIKGTIPQDLQARPPVTAIVSVAFTTFRLKKDPTTRVKRILLLNTSGHMLLNCANFSAYPDRYLRKMSRLFARCGEEVTLVGEGVQEFVTLTGVRQRWCEVDSVKEFCRKYIGVDTESIFLAYLKPTAENIWCSDPLLLKARLCMASYLDKIQAQPRKPAVTVSCPSESKVTLEERTSKAPLKQVMKGSDIKKYLDAKVNEKMLMFLREAVAALSSPLIQL